VELGGWVKQCKVRVLEMEAIAPAICDSPQTQPKYGGDDGKMVQPLIPRAPSRGRRGEARKPQLDGDLRRNRSGGEMGVCTLP